jgi:alpha/beta superfamily hydrolase
MFLDNEFPTNRTESFLRGPAGKLECIADSADPDEARAGTTIICHPHPQYGGTMNNKVVTILERSVRELGLNTVRFNFRGAGASDGEHDDGNGETDDLMAVAAWVRRTRPDDVLWLAGFSFGSYITLRAAKHLNPAQLISVAPPVKRYAFAELPHPRCPWLVIQGDEDDIVDVDDVRQWVRATDPEPVLAVMEHAGHFFHRRLMHMRDLLQDKLRANLPPKTDKP